jgi:hypothetical protein
MVGGGADYEAGNATNSLTCVRMAGQDSGFRGGGLRNISYAKSKASRHRFVLKECRLLLASGGSVDILFPRSFVPYTA